MRWSGGRDHFSGQTGLSVLVGELEVGSGLAGFDLPLILRTAFQAHEVLQVQAVATGLASAGE
jgi:hypothetical protein